MPNAEGDELETSDEGRDGDEDDVKAVGLRGGMVPGGRPVAPPPAPRPPPGLPGIVILGEDGVEDAGADTHEILAVPDHI